MAGRYVVNKDLMKSRCLPTTPIVSSSRSDRMCPIFPALSLIVDQIIISCLDSIGASILISILFLTQYRTLVDMVSSKNRCLGPQYRVLQISRVFTRPAVVEALLGDTEKHAGSYFHGIAAHGAAPTSRLASLFCQQHTNEHTF